MSQTVYPWEIEATGEEDIEQLERLIIEKVVDDAREFVNDYNRNCVQKDSVLFLAIRLWKCRILREDPTLPGRMKKVQQERDLATKRWQDIAPNAKLFMEHPY